MSATTATIPLEPGADWTPSKGVVGMTCLIIAESAIFTIFVVAYLFYLGKSLSGPTPAASAGIADSQQHLPAFEQRHDHLRVAGAEAKATRNDFGVWWLATILLGGYFLFGTGLEWHHLIYDKGLTIQTNLFGTTFYSLVGLHAIHVVVGLLGVLLVLVFALAGRGETEHAERDRGTGALLAFRGCGVDRRVYCGLRHRTLTKIGIR